MSEADRPPGGWKVQELARMLDVHKDTIYGWVKAGHCPLEGSGPRSKFVPGWWVIEFEQLARAVTTVPAALRDHRPKSTMSRHALTDALANIEPIKVGRRNYYHRAVIAKILNDYAHWWNETLDTTEAAANLQMTTSRVKQLIDDGVLDRVDPPYADVRLLRVSARSVAKLAEERRAAEAARQEAS